MKIKYLIPILLIVLVFSFGCTKKIAVETTTTAIPTTQTIVETTAPPTTIVETTVMVTETTLDETKEYWSQIVVIGLKISDLLEVFGQSSTDVGNGAISVSEYKEDTGIFIKEINNCYDIYLSLDVPEKFEKPHALMGTAMDHYTNMTDYLQQFIDTDNNSDMTDYLEKASSEMDMATEYINKATEQYSNIVN